MCDDLIHQGLTHDPTVSRRALGWRQPPRSCCTLPALRQTPR